MPADLPLSVWPTAQQPSRAQRAGRCVELSRTHPARMLPAIAARAITTYTAPGDLVVDPMCGIGTTLVEAVHLGRDAIGVEYEQPWPDLARGNLAHALSQGAAGHGEVICGDGCNTAGLVDPAARGLVALVLISPPYGPSLHGKVKTTPGGGVRKSHDRYSNDPANLAHVGLTGLLDAMGVMLAGVTRRAAHPPRRATPPPSARSPAQHRRMTPTDHDRRNRHEPCPIESPRQSAREKNHLDGTARTPPQPTRNRNPYTVNPRRPSGHATPRRWQRVWRALVRDERGAVSAELVIATPLLLLLIMGVIQFALWEHAAHIASAAAQQGVSVARLQGETPGAGQTESQSVLNQLGTSVLADPNVTANRTATTTTVTVTGHAESIIGIFTLPVKATASGPTENYTTADGGP